MNILGLAHEHDSGTAFLENGKLIYAANEERFDRKKFTYSFPQQAYSVGSSKFPDFVNHVDMVSVGTNLHTSQNINLENGSRIFNFILYLFSFIRLDRVFFGTRIGVKIVVGISSCLQIFRKAEIKKN